MAFFEDEHGFFFEDAFFACINRVEGQRGVGGGGGGYHCSSRYLQLAWPGSEKMSSSLPHILVRAFH